jgi:hypothetical protein
VYGRLSTHFLGHAPRGIAELHYISREGPSPLFDEAISWLREQYLGDEGSV